MNKTPQYQTVENRPIPCNFCGATVNGRIMEHVDQKTKTTIKECKWICARYGNLSKVGNIK